MTTTTDTPEFGVRPREASVAGRLLRSPLFWLGTLTLALVAVLAAQKLSGPRLPTEPLGHIRNFDFRDQSGAPFTAASFQGRVTLVNFIFTSCPDVCPLLTQKMKRLQEMARERRLPLQFVSISVDPETDTPEVLREYAATHKADTSNWYFVTGPLDEIQDVVVNSFKVALQRREAGESNSDGANLSADVESLMEITHGEQFALVDPQGRIRAYRRGDHDAGLRELLQLAAQAQ